MTPEFKIFLRGMFLGSVTTTFIILVGYAIYNYGKHQGEKP
jgi:hypothetical protein